MIVQTGVTGRGIASNSFGEEVKTKGAFMNIILVIRFQVGLELEECSRGERETTPTVRSGLGNETEGGSLMPALTSRSSEASLWPQS